MFNSKDNTVLKIFYLKHGDVFPKYCFPRVLLWCQNNCVFYISALFGLQNNQMFLKRRAWSLQSNSFQYDKKFAICSGRFCHHNFMCSIDDGLAPLSRQLAKLQGMFYLILKHFYIKASVNHQEQTDNFFSITFCRVSKFLAAQNCPTIRCKTS